MDNNPYEGAAKSDDIKSNVMGLALTGADGKPLDLSGQTMTMFVERAVAKEDDVPASIFPYRVTSDRKPLSFHQFNITSDNVSMVVELQAHDPLFDISAFIDFARKPGASKFACIFLRSFLGYFDKELYKQKNTNK